jgi:hypothetical protein
MPEAIPPHEVSEVRIPLVEEEVRISKRAVETGRVRVSTVVDEHEEVVRDLLLREDVRVERVPIGRQVAEIPQRVSDPSFDDLRHIPGQPKQKVPLYHPLPQGPARRAATTKPTDRCSAAATSAAGA